MCWATRLKPHILVAEKDIPTIKILRSTLESYYFSDFKYNIGEVKYSLLATPYHPIGFSEFLQIDYGLHSYHPDCGVVRTNLYIYVKLLKDSIITKYYDMAILVANCVIPEGSSYYLNEWGEYVSSRLKVISTI